MAKSLATSSASRRLLRPPAAYAIYVQSQKGLLKKFKRVRYSKKTSVFRLDLLKLKFDSLSQSERDVLVLASEKASLEVSRGRSSAIDGSPVPHTVATAISPRTVAPATAGDVGESPPRSGNWSARPTEGSLANDGVASSVTFTDLASGMQKVYKVVPKGKLGEGGWGCCHVLEDVATGSRLCGF